MYNVPTHYIILTGQNLAFNQGSSSNTVLIAVTERCAWSYLAWCLHPFVYISSVRGVWFYCYSPFILKVESWIQQHINRYVLDDLKLDCWNIKEKEDPF